MRGKINTGVSPARAALAAVAAAFLLWAACAEEEPVSRRASWREVATLPEGVRTFYGMTVAPDGAFYGVGTYRADSFSDPHGVVYRSDGEALEEIYRSPYEKSGFGAVTAADNMLWVAGAKYEDGDYRPYIVRRMSNRWEEVPFPYPAHYPSFSAAYAVSPEWVWFKNPQGIYVYEQGFWREVLALNESQGPDDFFVSTAGRQAFLVAPASKRNPPGVATVKIFVSDDRGTTWHEEKVVTPDPERPFYCSLSVIRGGGETVYGRTWLLLPPPQRQSYNDKTLVIFRRDRAPAGRGEYHVVFESAKSDYFTGISSMAFRSADEGYAVGAYTSVALDGGEWHVEAWQKSFSPWLEEVVAGPSGYWAVGMPRYEGPRRLYHIP